VQELVLIPLQPTTVQVRKKAPSQPSFSGAPPAVVNTKLEIVASKAPNVPSTETTPRTNTWFASTAKLSEPIVVAD